ncbi:MAG TPA: hypothetical protein GXZ36_10270 [Firmicutes bacterium]|nr:hypothetical protein [Bacillota bacterium]
MYIDDDDYAPVVHIRSSNMVGREKKKLKEEVGHFVRPVAYQTVVVGSYPKGFEELWK